LLPLLLLTLLPPPTTPLFPYTTLFRSLTEIDGVPDDELEALEAGVLVLLELEVEDEELLQAAAARHKASDADAARAPFLATRIKIGRATSELQSPCNLVCRLLLEKKKK